MSFHRIFANCILLLAFISGSVHATDLLEVFDLAKQNNLGFKLAKAKYNQRQLSDDIARGSYLPHLSVGGKWYKSETTATAPSLQETGQTFLDIFNNTCSGDLTCVAANLVEFTYTEKDQTYERQEGSITIKQTIYDQSKIERMYEAKKTLVLSEHERSVAEEELFDSVLKAYLNVLTALNERDFAEQQLESIKVQQVLAKKRYRLGVGKETDVYDAQAIYDAQVIKHEAAKSKYIIALRTLSSMVGKELEFVFPVSPNLPVVMPYPATPDSWIESAVKNNPKILQARATQSVAKYKIRAEKMTRVPKLDFYANYLKSRNKGDDEFSTTGDVTSYGIELSIPLYAGGQISARSRIEEYNYQQASYSLDNEIIQLQVEVINALSQVKFTVNEYKARERSVQSSAKALEVTRIGYEDGANTLLNLFDSQEKFFQAKKELASTRYRYVEQIFDLKQLSGTFTLKDIEDFNAWFQPEF